MLQMHSKQPVNEINTLDLTKKKLIYFPLFDILQEASYKLMGEIIGVTFSSNFSTFEVCVGALKTFYNYFL